ncbi:MAG: 50S ribosomal protein L11 methyltransferase [Puniceicoccales bacterium]|jgi:ribosomal protein L11 methyltransferase|nr:50S ribosomal protein L11 methyltransferase [Puniceicoccales bacterium]
MIKFTLKLKEEDAEAVNTFLLEEEFRECVIDRNCESGSCCVCGYFESKAAGEKIFRVLGDKFSAGNEIAVESIAETDWVNEYKKHCQPWSYQHLLWVPLWMKDEVAAPSEDCVPVYIDAGMAFGTGMHETTRLCARALVMFSAMYRSDGSWCIKKCIDVGCGTGILGISAIKCGLQRAFLIDNDENAIAASRENAAHNGIDPSSIDYLCADLKLGLLGREADLVFANILANTLMENSDILASSVKPGGMLCLSGILVSEMPDVRAAFEKSFGKFWISFIENRAKYGEWGMLTFLRG